MTEKYRRKLIEVALPLEAINVESAREKSIRHGHPSTLHLWWARRPLAACRAVLFSSIVDDPSEYMPDEDSANAERERLFDLIEDLVLWDNVNNEDVLDKARLEIARSVARDLGVDMPVGKQAIREFLATKAPPVLDPFAGGGSIPLEAQRLGLRAYASDLNPVAVLINKALIEIPPKFAGMPPIHPPDDATGQSLLWKKEWKGAEGLAEDVRYYGKWMRDEAYKRIGHLYPPVKITEEILAERPDLKAQGIRPGDELTVIAWLWARTVKCPNPACGAHMPLVRSFALSTKKGRQAWVEPVVERSEQMPRIHFSVKTGMGSPPNGTVKRTGANCIACGTPVPFNHIRSEGQAGRMKAELMVIVAEGKNGRLYLPPSVEYEAVATQAKPEWIPDADLTHNPRDFKTPKYGMRTFGDLFTNRQLVALTTLSSLVDEAQKQVLDHARRKAVHSDSLAYANAVATYLSLGVSKLADALTSLVRWKSSMDQAIATFGRQALPMVWDYAESNTFNGAAGDFSTTINNLARVLDNLNSHISGVVRQLNAAEIDYDHSVIISTDPPYYDNIDYADLSDFFYIWLRKSLAKYYPGLFATVLVPKTQELIAAPHRFGGDRQKANDFFENGLRNVFKKMYTSVHMGFPLTVFYAFKQVEVEDGEDDDQPSMRITETRVSTGWETMLEGLLSSNFQITGTWPMRTELSNRTLASEKNALASSIILACRPRSIEAPIINRRDFLSLLKREIPPALRQLQQGNIAPVDLAQAAIGPGMAVFSRYKQVLEGDGSPMGVRTALGIINQALDEFLAEQEGEYDGDTRWALAWYEQYGHDQGPYGVAETLSKAKNTSVEGLVEACILEARAGKVRLLRRDELDPDWDPQKDKRPTAWEACQHLIFGLEKGGEQTAATLLAKLGILSESTRDLAYRLYTICERKNRTQEALYYNMLVIAWPRLKELARSKQEATQGRLI